MRFVTLDLETFFSDEFTLKKLSTENYIRDPRFEAHGAAVKWSPNTLTRWYNEPALRYHLSQEDWSDTALVCWHAQFDAFILSHHYNVRPKLIICPMSMSRLLIGNHISVSLDSVRSHFGLPPKLTPYNLCRGLYWNQMKPDVQRQVAEGACDEVESIWKIFGILAKQFPSEEYETVDTTIKMFTNPVLRADVDALAKVWEDENNSKIARLAALDVIASDLQSADKFAALLRQAGVEPATKNGKNNDIYAFAKTDDFMQDLLESEDDYVRTLAEARLGIKSTMMQTRAETLGFAAQRGPLPVYLRYCGAHTTRWSGGDGNNWQNMNGKLEAAILPPEGTVAFAPDSSQIECRLLNMVAGQMDKIEEFRQGKDPYVGVAEAFCGHEVTKESHPVYRQGGKVVELQAGYGSGDAKIEATLKRFKIPFQPGDGGLWKQAYRETHPFVEDLWRTGGRMIARLAGGAPLDWGPVRVEPGRIILPNGCPMIYSDLNYYKDEESGEQYWRHKTRHGWAKLYGAKLVENLIQALARVVISQAMVRLKRLGYDAINMKHDAIWYALPQDRAEEHKRVIMTEMKRSPDWLSQIPLDAEGSLGTRFGK
jgi:hypothetical protein